MSTTTEPTGPPPADDQGNGIPQLVITHYPDGRTEVGTTGEMIDFATALSMIELAKFNVITQYLQTMALQRQQAQQAQQAQESRIIKPHQPAILKPS